MYQKKMKSKMNLESLNETLDYWTPYVYAGIIIIAILIIYTI